MQASAPPRLLVRRALALVVDSLLVTAVVIALFLPFTGAGMRLPAPVIAVRGFTCAPVEQAPAWLSQILGDTGPYTLRLCDRTLFGLPDGQELRVVLSDDREAAQRTSRQLSVPVNAALEPVTTKPWGSVTTLLLLALLSAWFTARGWQTPGKRLFALRIVPEGRPRPLWREALRLGPLALIAVLPTLPGGLPVTALGIWGVIALSALIALGLIWYYAWPFVHWTGQSRHDRHAGFRVTQG
ncbi:RDD family protein [Pararhodobacter sp. CCB-MM2]|uniref:RDD family protein n=1 Tax=Pararhodobacter sp. CCB-MM2 TaxID=1786003 RepID=UPI00082FFF18|nr:RDD family protein [Pararhodobacter sp. CCB-MM2]